MSTSPLAATGTPQARRSPWLLRGSGALLVAFAAGVWAIAARPPLRHGAVLAVIAANVLWSTASVAAAAAGIATRRAGQLLRMSDVTDATASSTIGELLRHWRQRRHMSQLELALQAAVSTRHLSIVETGRSRPSADMVVHLAEQLEVPLRDRNTLLLAAGYAPAYRQRALEEPEMGPIRGALERVLAGHEPYPAVVLDRHWGMVAGNRAIALLTAGGAEHLLEPPVNELRLALHPEGLAPRIANHGRPGAPRPARGARGVARRRRRAGRSISSRDIAVPLRLHDEDGELAFISTVTTFGIAVDVTVAELMIESFFPADARTVELLHARAAAPEHELQLAGGGAIAGTDDEIARDRRAR